MPPIFCFGLYCKLNTGDGGGLQRRENTGILQRVDDSPSILHETATEAKFLRNGEIL